MTSSNTCKRQYSNRNKNRFRLLLLLALACFVCHAGIPAFSQTPPTIKTDLGVYAEPQPPALPPRGGKFRDPTFGTEVMRVTDERDGTHLGTYYSYWPTFNKDNTRLLVGNYSGAAFIRKFDPAGFVLGEKENIPPIPGVGNPVFEGATWSGTDPDVLFLTANASIYAYHTDTRRYELLADISPQMPNEYIKQPSFSLDGNRVGFTRKRFSDYAETGYAVYDIARKSLILSDAADRAGLDEVTISQSGRYLLAKRGNAPVPSGVESVVYDLDAQTQVPLIDDSDAAPGHGDAGLDSYVGYDNFGNRVTWRSLSNPKKFRTLLQFTEWGHGFGHASLRAVDERWVLISFFGTTEPGPLRNEILQLATDGSGRVRRLLHHHSVYRSYYDSARANISFDGQFVAFTSNWGGSARTDLFVARVPQSPPAAPSCFAAGFDGPHLRWRDNSNNEVGFIIEGRPLAGGRWAKVGEAVENVTSWEPGYGGGYLYRVKAINAAGSSAYSYSACPGCAQSAVVCAPAVTWRNLRRATAQANGGITASRDGSSWPPATGTSAQAIMGDGSFKFYINHTGAPSDYVMNVGLNSGDTTTVEYVWAISSGYAQPYVNGVYMASTSVTTSDALRIDVEAGVVKFYKNAELIYASDEAPLYPLNANWSSGYETVGLTAATIITN